MSFQAMKWALSEKLPKRSQKLVLMVLADHASQDDWVAWPGRASIAEKTNLDPTSVRRALRALETAGLIKTQQR